MSTRSFNCQSCIARADGQCAPSHIDRLGWFAAQKEMLPVLERSLYPQNPIDGAPEGLSYGIVTAKTKTR
jgi:hypothetical protein